MPCRGDDEDPAGGRGGRDNDQDNDESDEDPARGRAGRDEDRDNDRRSRYLHLRPTTHFREEPKNRCFGVKKEFDRYDRK